jgi:2-succinyl-6-hydroxy-2,4-cyclohexadiene-1-carboxylate synthase
MTRSRRFGILTGDLREGEHPALVLLHGQLLDRKVMEDLAARLGDHRVLNLDLPGHGDSAPVAFSSMTQTAAAVVDAIADAQLVEPVLVGHSLGAVVALHAAKTGANMGGAILLGCPGALSDEQRAQQRAIGTMLDPLTDAVVDLVVQTWFSTAWREAHPEAADLVRSWLSSNGVQAATAVGNAIAEAQPIRGPLEVPIGAVSFAEDLAAPRGPQEQLMRSLGANEKILPCGHMGPVEAPAGLAESVRDLVAQLRAAAGAADESAEGN